MTFRQSKIDPPAGIRCGTDSIEEIDVMDETATFFGFAKREIRVDLRGISMKLELYIQEGRGQLQSLGSDFRRIERRKLTWRLD